jgi:hypothetical protein
MWKRPQTLSAPRGALDEKFPWRQSSQRGSFVSLLAAMEEGMLDEQKPFFLIGMSDRGDAAFDLVYGQIAADPSPFVLTITREYVACKTSQPPATVSRLDVTDFINRNVNELRQLAVNSKASGHRSELLK